MSERKMKKLTFRGMVLVDYDPTDHDTWIGKFKDEDNTYYAHFVYDYSGKRDMKWSKFKVDDEMVLKFTPKGLREVMGRNYEIISCPKIQEKNE